MHRFFSDVRIDSDAVELAGSEHQHLSKVMRLRAGDVVTLFDDSGHEFTASIDQVERNATKLSITTSELVDRELPFALTIGVALPKGDRQQWLVEKLVELGVTTLVPLNTKRGVAQPSEKALLRLRRWIVAGSKQSRRNRLMRVESPQTINQLFAKLEDDVETVRLIAHPGVESQATSVVSTISRSANVIVSIGPEGGFSDDEVQTAIDLQATPVCLGPRILRIETAALAMSACLVFRKLT